MIFFFISKPLWKQTDGLNKARTKLKNIIKSFEMTLNLKCHSYKKRKDSLETRAERAVLHAYVENQAILEFILLYRASKYKQTK